MKAQLITQLVAIMRELPASKDVPWTETTTVVYSTLLRSVADDLYPMLENYALRVAKWRPAPAELFQVAAREANKVPPPADIIEAIREIVIMRDMSSRKERERVADQLPMIDHYARAIGGWQAIRGMNTDELPKAVNAKYAAATEDFMNTEIAQVAISLPSAERNAICGTSPVAGGVKAITQRYHF